jgi:tetratricopeptide (TPR) repeat protein
MKNATAIALLLALSLTVALASPAYTATRQSPSADGQTPESAHRQPSAPIISQASNAKIPNKKRDGAAEKLFREGKKAFREGHYDTAAKLYQQLTKLDNSDVQAHLQAAYSFLKNHDFQAGFDHANEVLKFHPGSARAYAIAGAALLRSGFVTEAVFSINQAFKLDPKEPLAFGTAAEVDYYEGRAKESIGKAVRAHELDPNEPDYLMTIARASSRLEMFEQAAAAYERFLAVAPINDKERRERITGLIQFYRQLAGIEVHELSGPTTAEVPFQLGNDRRPYIRLKINGRDATFVIDTGSGFTVISKEAAKRFKVSEIARGGRSQGVGGSGKFSIVYGLIKSMEFSTMKMRSIPCFIRPFHGDRDSERELQADGFIGLSILSHVLTELDYQDNVIRLNQETKRGLPVVAQSGTTVVPFRTTQNGLISVETELDGKNRINAILDSGASSTVISVAAVERLRMHEQIIKGQTTRVIGAGGISDNVELLHIRNCRVADLRQDNVRALVLDFDAINETAGFEQSGILGGDFLRHFSITIDFVRAQVVLRPYTSSIKKVAPLEKPQNSD